MSKFSDYHVEPGQEVTVDLFRPEDAEGVAACFHRVYGAGYPVKTYLDPELITQANADQSVISSVARAADGKVVGHNALFASAPSRLTYESGAGLVLPEYRNTAKLFIRMIDHGIKLAPNFGVACAFGEPVLNHPFSQKAVVSLDFINTAIEVGLMPAKAYGPNQKGERVSTMLCFSEGVPRPHTAWLPPRYRDDLLALYEKYGQERDLQSGDQALPAGAATRLESQVYDFASVVRMALWQAGEDLAATLDREEAAAREQGVKVFQAWVNLGQPCSGRVVEELARRGYFVGGLLPRWFDDDGFLMQRVEADPSWEEMIIAFEADQGLATMALRDWERARGA